VFSKFSIPKKLYQKQKKKKAKKKTVKGTEYEFLIESIWLIDHNFQNFDQKNLKFSLAYRYDANFKKF